MCISTHVACCHVRHKRCKFSSQARAYRLLLFKARVALSGSTDYINSHCACIQIYRDVFSSRHHRSATAIVMLSA